MAEPLNGQDALRLVLNVLRRVTDKDDRQRVVRALNEMFPEVKQELHHGLPFE